MESLSLICPECNEPFISVNPKSLKYCPNCGKRIQLIIASAEKTEAAEPPTQPTPPAEAAPPPIPATEADIPPQSDDTPKATVKKRRSRKSSDEEKDKKTSFLSLSELTAIQNRYRKAIANLSVCCAMLFTAVILALLELNTELYIGCGALILLQSIVVLFKYLLDNRKEFIATSDTIVTKAKSKTSGKTKIVFRSIKLGTTTYEEANRILRHSGLKNVYLLPQEETDSESEKRNRYAVGSVTRITANGKKCTVSKNDFFDSNTIFVIYYRAPKTQPSITPSIDSASSTGNNDHNSIHSPNKNKKEKSSSYSIFDACDYGGGLFGSHHCDCDDDCDDDCDCDCHDD